MVRRDGRRGVVFALTLAGFVVGCAFSARGDEDARTAAAFVQGLRARGYYDLAAEYLEKVRKQPDAPEDLTATADYELGRLLLDEAAKSGDLVRRKDLLEDARVKLETFTKENPKHAKTAEALVELARLLVERGHLAMLQSDDAESKTEKDAKVAEARASFDRSRTAYAAADERLKGVFAKYPPYLQDNDPRKDEKEQVHTAMMNAELQKAVVDYEQGQTYAVGSKERTELMSQGLEQFETLYKRYRTQLAGLSARMWQAKCYEERGDLGPAMGIYNELMEHSDPRLRPLQRYVGWFRIITLSKRKEYALAADESLRWLQANNSPEALRSKEGLGVQLELAKNKIALLPDMQSEKEKNAEIKRIGDVLSGVVRYSSPFKAEALALLKKYKPSAAVRAEDVARLNYDDAIAGGEQALSAHEWDRAEALLKQAVRRAEAAKNIDQVNTARYDLAFGYYMNKRWYDALVLADHITRRYPKAGLAPKAAEIGMASLLEAYNNYKVDQATDLNNLIELARYTEATYPEFEQGDSARMMLGQIYHGTGRYPQAVEAFTSVRPKSSKYLDARTKLGASYWEQSKFLRGAGKTAESDAQVAKAIETLQGAMKTRQDNGAPPTDPGLLSNACDIADIYLETSRPAEALKLLDPLAKTPNLPTGSALARLTADMLRAHIGVSQVELAMQDMAKLEKAGGEGNLTQLYFGLGKLLEKEMDALKKRGDSAGLSRTQGAYQKFLTALVSSKAGQTYESLQWAGENMLTLGHPKEAEDTFKRILEMFEKDQKFQSAPGAADRVFRTRLKLCAAYRGGGKFSDAKTLVDTLKQENPRAIEPMMEEGYLIEAMAAAGTGNWNAAQGQWQKIANRLGATRVKPIEYFDAWYHVAFCLNKVNKTKEAKQALALVMRLSPSVGGPDMKDKYKKLIDQMK